jgi:hypothetical protein
MHRLTVWLVVLLYLGTSVQECGFARDEGRFAPARRLAIIHAPHLA